MWLLFDQPGGSLVFRDASGARHRVEGQQRFEVDEPTGERLLASQPNMKSSTDPGLEAAASQSSAPAEAEVDTDPAKHEFLSDRSGLHCLVCEGEEAGHLGYVEPAEVQEQPVAKPKSGAITTSDLSAGARKGGRRKKST